MVIRAKGLLVTVGVVVGLVGLIGLATAVSPKISGGGRAIAIVVVLTAILTAVRLGMSGLRLEPDAVTVRGVASTDRLPRAEVLGLAVQPFLRGRFRRIAVVCVDGRIIPAEWTVASRGDVPWLQQASWAAYGFGPTQPNVAERLDVGGRRIESDEPLPLVTLDPGLTPTTVGRPDPADGSSRWLGWETIFVVTAFALPGIAGAVEILAKHLGGVSDLNEFDLPLPHNPAVSLPVLLLGYFTTALVVPIALLLLARTGQPPAALGLERTGWRRDIASSAMLLVGVWASLLVVSVALAVVVDNKHLTNQSTNSHVPAYYIIYALFVSATTAINEEVLVNGYFLTRLSQRGWSPWRAFALSLTVRTSYHVYYGLGFILTIPLGYIVTRSFQKRQRLARPILVHFTYDAILLVIAVLTS